MDLDILYRIEMSFAPLTDIDWKVETFDCEVGCGGVNLKMAVLVEDVGSFAVDLFAGEQKAEERPLWLRRTLFEREVS